jgi:hypothetical protein
VSQPSQSPPPKPASNSLKYVLIGLLFLGATVGVLMLGREPPAPPPAAPAPAAPEPERANPLAQQDLVLEPEPEPTPEPTAPEPTNKPKGSSQPKATEWECSGDLAGATSVINENRTQIRSCYERRLKVNNVLQGDVKLRIRVGTTGKVTATATAGSLRDADVLSCMRQLAQGWTFAAPSGGSCAVLSVPFRFSPKAP